MSLWWCISFGALGLFATLYFGRNDFLQKPERLNVRDTPLLQSKKVSSSEDFSKMSNYQVDELPQEDVVYGGIRRLS